MPSKGKILITSKDQRKEPRCRKPIRECYCNLEGRKVHHKDKILKKSSSLSDCSKDSSDAVQMASRKDNEEQSSSPLSSDTLRRINKINYVPKSQFLRNVRSKASLDKKATFFDQSDKCPRLNCHERLQGGADIKRDKYYHRIPTASTLESSNTYRLEKSDSLPEMRNLEENHGACSQMHKCPKISQTNAKAVNRKPTVFSKRSLPGEKRERSLSGFQTRSRKNMEARREKDCYCKSCKKVHGSSRKDASSKEDKRTCGSCSNCWKHAYTLKEEMRNLVDEHINELRKFRDQNYFDTHGSEHTLSSSVSSDSVQQCYLNDRLFPEPVRRVQRDKLAVTLPPCATKQGKRIHCFPRYVVWQNKSSGRKLPCNEKRRCQGCPLTGHAIDLGALKRNLPSNSLALEFQKRLP
ncbi:uncharacterized protein [Prorops nasuta]